MLWSVFALTWSRSVATQRTSVVTNLIDYFQISDTCLSRTQQGAIIYWPCTFKNPWTLFLVLRFLVPAKCSDYWNCRIYKTALFSCLLLKKYHNQYLSECCYWTPHVNAVFLTIYVMQCPCKSNIPVQCTVFTSTIIRYSAELSYYASGKDNSQNVRCVCWN